jgi:hypothetical protein
MKNLIDKYVKFRTSRGGEELRFTVAYKVLDVQFGGHSYFLLVLNEKNGKIHSREISSDVYLCELPESTPYR